MGTATIKFARASRARPFVVAVNAVASVLAVSVSVVCDQVDQVVPAHQVDDINEVHELDPVHQVDHIVGSELDTCGQGWSKIADWADGSELSLEIK